MAQAGWMGEVCGDGEMRQTVVSYYLEIYLARVVGDCVPRSEYRC